MAGDNSIVTIDGPAGSGKSTVARSVAGRLGFHFLDTGAMYRAATLAAIEAGVSLAPPDPDAVVTALREACLELADSGAVTLRGRPVEDRIRTPLVTGSVSIVAAVPAVREILTERQREFGRRVQPGLVAEGRDMATVVFPGAHHRFFLDASVEVRARRRAEEMRRCGMPSGPMTEVVAEIRARDERDSARDSAPLRIGAGVQVVDTTDLTVAEVVARILAAVEARS